MPICERCGKEHDGSFGSGRFCCRSCANSRNHSDETKRKIKDGVNNFILTNFGDLDSGVFINKREKRRIERKQKKDELRCFVYSSDDVKFLTHPSIDFGENYIISKCGRIISSKTLKCLSPAFKNWNDLYIRYVLTDTCGNRHMLTAHRLVAYNFIPNPDNLPLINHKDENPSNNSVDNLEWCTYQYNATYNDAHIKRGKALSEYMKSNGGNWNKGKRLKRK